MSWLTEPLLVSVWKPVAGLPPCQSAQLVSLWQCLGKSARLHLYNWIEQCNVIKVVCFKGCKMALSLSEKKPLLTGLQLANIRQRSTKQSWVIFFYLISVKISSFWNLGGNLENCRHSHSLQHYCLYLPVAKIHNCWPDRKTYGI